MYVSKIVTLTCTKLYNSLQAHLHCSSTTSITYQILYVKDFIMTDNDNDTPSKCIMLKQYLLYRYSI